QNVIEDLWLKVPTEIPPIEVYTEGEQPPPIDLISFVQKATAPGSRNPFMEEQGVKGSYGMMEYVDKDGPADPLKLGRTLFKVRPDPGNINTDILESSRRKSPQAKLIFEGFLYYKSETVGSYAWPWNDNWDEDDFEMLK